MSRAPNSARVADRLPRLTKKIGLWSLRLIGIVLITVSVLSAVESNQWWVRIWDFPRLQILVAIVITALLILLVDTSWRIILFTVLLLAGGWQLYRIFPYTKLAAPEVAFSEANDIAKSRCFSVLSLNVYQENRDYQRVLALVRQTDPDILLLLETDKAWQQAMEPVLSKYSSRLERPLGNTYGLIFATRLPMSDARIENIAEADTPSVTATLIAGNQFKLIGLHPRPPHPGQDTEERDAEIAIAATRARKTSLPVLAIGDFNDVAWSDTSQHFKRIGGYLDPRVGRGTFATFPADYPLLAWPLDHVFITPEFVVRSMHVLDNVGSDHLPVFTELCLAPKKARSINSRPDKIRPDDREEIVDTMDEYRRDQEDD
jgi:endonuclease/exonuclease/phosphatase (EEP) superfamily protein YafD